MTRNGSLLPWRTTRCWMSSSGVWLAQDGWGELCPLYLLYTIAPIVIYYCTCTLSVLVLSHERSEKLVLFWFHSGPYLLLLPFWMTSDLDTWCSALSPFVRPERTFEISLSRLNKVVDWLTRLVLSTWFNDTALFILSVICSNNAPMLVQRLLFILRDLHWHQSRWLRSLFRLLLSLMWKIWREDVECVINCIVVGPYGELRSNIVKHYSILDVSSVFWPRDQEFVASINLNYLI